MRLLPFAAAAPACIASPHLAAQLAEYRGRGAQPGDEFWQVHNPSIPVSVGSGARAPVLRGGELAQLHNPASNNPSVAVTKVTALCLLGACNCKHCFL